LIARGKTHFHVLKHTLGTLLLGRQNASAFLIRQCLGHKSLSSSMQCVNVSDQDADTTAQKVFMDVF